jgi:hypothetical protein
MFRECGALALLRALPFFVSTHLMKISKIVGIPRSARDKDKAPLRDLNNKALLGIKKKICLPSPSLLTP